MITNRTAEKLLKKHEVTVLEVEEAFFNGSGTYLIDERAEHATVPPTVWFISETMDGRVLKVVMKIDTQSNVAWLKTAFDPTDEEIVHYEANT